MSKLPEYTLCFLERFIHSIRSPLSVSSTLLEDLLAGYKLEQSELKDCKSSLARALDLCRYLELSLSLLRESEEAKRSLLSRLNLSAPLSDSRFDCSSLEELLNAALKHTFKAGTLLEFTHTPECTLYVLSKKQAQEKHSTLLNESELLKLEQTLEMAALVFILSSAEIQLKAERAALLSAPAEKNLK